MKAKNLTKKHICGIVALIVLIALIAAILIRFDLKKEYSNSYFDYFDSFATITVYAESEDNFNVYDTIFKTELERYHKLLDIYNSYDGIVNLHTINTTAGGGAVTVSSDLFSFIEAAVRMHTLTNGYTSISMGAVTSIWKDAIANKTLPDEAALAAAAEHTDISYVVLEGLDKTVEITDPLLQLDAGALGKGYVCDVIYNALLEAGCESFLINIGGTVCAHGEKSGGVDWRAGIQNANGESLDMSLRIAGMSLSTSGSYYRSFELDGTLYHHIISPTTLKPENTFSSVSVICHSAMEADALSTALFSMSEDEGRALIGKLENTDAVWQYRDGAVSSSDGIESLSK